MPQPTLSGKTSASSPVVLFIEGDAEDEQQNGLAVKNAIDTAVQAAYGDQKSIAWLQVLAGKKSFQQIGDHLPAGTVAAINQHGIGLRAPVELPETIDAAPLSVPGLFSEPADLLNHLGWPEAAAALDATNT